MGSRLTAGVVASMALLAAQSLAPFAAAQQVTPVPARESANGYVVPVLIGVVAGALIWPLLVPAAADAVIAGGAAGAAPFGGAAAVDAAAPAAAAPAALELGAPAGTAVPPAGMAAVDNGWGWRTVLALPAVVGGLIGGVLGYAVAR